jgi:hypothetical protein
MRQVRVRNGFSTDTVCVPRSRDERVGSQTTCRRNSSRSRRFAAESASPDRQRVVIGQVCDGCHWKKGYTADGVNCCHRHCQPCAARSSGDIPSGRSHDCTQRATSIGCAGHESCSKDICNNATVRPVDSDLEVSLPQGYPERGQKYTYTHDDTRSCSRRVHGAVLSSLDGCTPSDNTKGCAADTCEKLHTAQAQISCAFPPNDPLGLDGSSEEAKSDRPRAVERRRTRREKAPSQVASRIRELELKNAMPAPLHFRPAGHTRHDHYNRNHRSQLHRDEKPNVDLIFPLHVRRFPRRTSDGSPYRPETPLHRSIPDEEPYIHAPQPARSMPMLKDPPEHDSHPSPKPELLDTSHGNQDGFAVASGYGRCASKNFAVRRNSRP